MAKRKQTGAPGRSTTESSGELEANSPWFLPEREPGAMLRWVMGEGPEPVGPRAHHHTSPLAGADELDRLLLEQFHGIAAGTAEEGGLSRRVRDGLGTLLTEFKTLWLAWGAGAHRVQRHKRELAAQLEKVPPDRAVKVAAADRVRGIYDDLHGAVHELVAFADDGRELRAWSRFAERIAVAETSLALGVEATTESIERSALAAEDLRAQADRLGRHFIYAVTHALCSHAAGEACRGESARPLTPDQLAALALEHCPQLERRFRKTKEGDEGADRFDRARLRKRLRDEALLGERAARAALKPGRRRP